MFCVFPFGHVTSANSVVCDGGGRRARFLFAPFLALLLYSSDHRPLQSSLAFPRFFTQAFSRAHAGVKVDPCAFVSFLLLILLFCHFRHLLFGRQTMVKPSHTSRDDGTRHDDGSNNNNAAVPTGQEITEQITGQIELAQTSLGRALARFRTVFDGVDSNGTVSAVDGTSSSLLLLPCLCPKSLTICFQLNKLLPTCACVRVKPAWPLSFWLSPPVTHSLLLRPMGSLA